MKRYAEAVSTLTARIQTEPDLDLDACFHELGIATYEVDATMFAIQEHTRSEDEARHALYVGILIGREMST
jgi:hypothetical protein